MCSFGFGFLRVFFFLSILFSVVSTLFSVVFWLLYCMGFGVPVFFVLRMYSLLPFHVASRPAALLSVVRCRAEHIVSDDDVVTS